MSRRRPRSLRADEKQLWQQVASTAHPLRREEAQQIIAHAADPASVPKQVPLTLDSFAIKASSSAALSKVTYVPPLGDRIVQMDNKAFGRMKRGKLVPEARVDLHGMTLARAHPVLNDFILSSHASGKRLVLVITGKGKDRDDGGPIPARRGILRHQVPDWLRMMPLAPCVLQVTPAHLKHGGQGAYYVYLRRSR